MSDELIPGNYDDETLPAREEQTAKLRYRQAYVERMMRVYGNDFIQAFELFMQAHQVLDNGSPALAGTMARRASIYLRDSGKVNDKDRPQIDITAEICRYFDPSIDVDPMGNKFVRNRDCIREVMYRLDVSESVAIGLIKEVHDRPQLPSGGRPLGGGEPEGLLEK